MKRELFITLILNVGILLLIAGTLVNIKFVRRLLIKKDEKIENRLLLGIIFGVMSIVSTYIGLGVHGAIVNTRVIGVLAAGILGGPYVGMVAAILAGIHRYFFDISGLTSFACAISTVFEGAIGSVAYLYLEKRKTSLAITGLIAVGAQILQMIIILLIAKPFSAAWELVQVIALPMILINSFGTMLFFSTFNRIYLERDYDISYHQSQVLKIAERSLPHLRNGLNNEVAMKKVVDIICQAMPEFRAIITNSEQILADSKEISLPLDPVDFVKRAITVDDTILQSVEDGKKSFCIIAAPLKEGDGSVGGLVVITKKQRIATDTDKLFVEGLARLFSTMLELSKISYEIEMKRKMEFRALQAQINPHFLYNTLNTLSSICRENPKRTRELLLLLSHYFRYTLEINKEFISLKDEVKAIKSYLEIEFARFEDKLRVCWEIDSELNGNIPPLLLQPLVENAVKYGAKEDGTRDINISIKKGKNSLLFQVQDQGKGFPREELERFQKEEKEGYSGIYNVHRRIKNIYPGNQGLMLSNKEAGAEVRLEIPLM